MAESRTANVFKNTAARLLQRVASILVQFILRTIFIYLLGKEYTGVSGLFTDILNVLSLMEAGLDTSMVYALYKPLADNDQKRIKALLDFYKKAFFIIGVLVLVIGIAIIPFLGIIIKDVPNIREDIRLIFVFYVVTSASSYFFVYRTVLLNADQKSRVISKWRTIVQIAECVLEVALLFVFRQFLVYLIIHLAATLANNFIVSRITTRRYPQYFCEKNVERLSRDETVLILRDILCLTAYNFSGVVINSTDSIFISAFIGTVEVAIIGNFTLIINSIRTVVSQIVDVTKPSIGNLAVTSGRDRQEAVFLRMNFISFYVATFCSACFYTLLNPFVGDIWFDPSYKTSSLVLAILTLNFYVAVMVYPVESFRTANGLFVQGWIRPVVMAGLNIVLDFFMGQRWGIVGIFLATTISRCLTQVWFDPYLVFKIVFKKKPWKFLADYVLKFLFAVVVCGITALVSNCVTFENVYLAFCGKVVVAAVVPNVVLTVVYWRNEDYKYLIQRMKGKLLKK